MLVKNIGLKTTLGKNISHWLLSVLIKLIFEYPESVKRSLMLVEDKILFEFLKYVIRISSVFCVLTIK